MKTFVNVSFRDQNIIGQGSSNRIKIAKKNKTVLITNNGRLDQRARFENVIVEDYFESGVHTLR